MLTQNNVPKIIGNLYRVIKIIAAKENLIVNFSLEQFYQKLSIDGQFISILNRYTETKDQKDFPIVIPFTKESIGSNKVTIDDIQISTKNLHSAQVKTKVCTRCKLELPLSDFGKVGSNARGHADGHHDYCKKCVQYKLKEPNLVLSSIYRYHSKKGTDLKFTREEFWDRFLKEDSDFMKLHKEWDRKTLSKTPRLKLIDESKGYTLDNITFTTIDKMKEEAMHTDTKKCIVCKRILPKDKFGKNSKTLDGYSTDCLECRNSIAKRKDRLGWHIYSNQVSKSIQRKHPKPTYTKEELQEWLNRHPSYDRMYDEWVKSNYDIKLKPSIDRIYNHLGYSFENIRLVTWDTNNKKEHKGVDIFNLDGTVYKRCGSIKEAAEYSGIKPSTLGEYLRRNLNPINGKVYMYSKDYNANDLKRILERIKESGTENKNGNVFRKYKAVIAFTHDGKLYKNYSSIIEVAKDILGKDNLNDNELNRVRSAANGKIKSGLNGYILIYKDDYSIDLLNTRIEEYKKYKRKRISYINKDGEEKIYDTISEAIENTEYSEKPIVRSLRTGEPTRKGEYFKYLED